ncbi:hypothetical protein [Candidatus Enterococcus courvalinii]|uniref:Integral membrane protein n=1 Tax=Candidatus Enterococcus courvalinii TaxID=2815329 RepID=A0ABS3HX47_9ENTE|nr:hypothetical protein [Enterococcus sp. MSG2901]MBO0481044.1 hypothetical protein [Enterococcus sp. MSG2901]
MTITIVLCLLALIALIIIRKLTTKKLSSLTLFLEMVATSSLSYLAALLIWFSFRQVNFSFTNGRVWLVWLLMFLSGVLGVRTLGKRLMVFNQQTNSQLDVAHFAKELAYHAGVFWKLIIVIAMATFFATATLPTTFVLLSLSLVVTIALIIESAVQLFQIK